MWEFKSPVDWPFKFALWSFLNRDFLANQRTEIRRKDILIPHNCLELVKRNIYTIFIRHVLMTSGNTSTMPEIQEHVIVNC